MRGRKARCSLAQARKFGKGEAAGAGARGRQGRVEVEELEREDAPGGEEAAAAALADAPELAALLAELQGSLAEVRSRVGPLLAEARARPAATRPRPLRARTSAHVSKRWAGSLIAAACGLTRCLNALFEQHAETLECAPRHRKQRLAICRSSGCRAGQDENSPLGGAQVRQGRLATAEGMSYLEAKHLLLLHYCMRLVFLLLLKAEGRPVRSHPVVGRLVEARAFLERLRPLDRRLRYQVDKLLAAAAAVLARPPEPRSSQQAACA